MQFITNPPLHILIVFLLSYANFIEATHRQVTNWPTPDQEALDEQNDSDIIKAVQHSMTEWKMRSYKQHRRKRADKNVCYGDLGCFEDAGPFGYLDMLPSSPEEINTRFQIYSTRNRSDRPLMEFSFFNLSTAWGGDGQQQNTFSPAAPSDTNQTEIGDKASVAVAAENGDGTSGNFKKTMQPKSLDGFVQTQSIMTTTTTTTTPTSITMSATSTTTTTTPTTTHATPSALLPPVAGLENWADVSTRVIVHGFGAGCNHVWIYEMRTALMAVEDCVVLCVDWENGSTLPNYVRAAANTRLVGKQLAMLLQGLSEHRGIKMSKVHIIGFSLGAHVAGFAGSELPGLSRITGLDPAGPLFEAQHPKARLDSTDAAFVDVVHSNGENLILGGLGSWQPMGHVDFYPNGGRVQNGCSNLFVGAVTDFIWSPTTTVEGRSLCNHRRAYKFFIDSVAPRCLFPAFPCDNYDDFLMGKCFPCTKASLNTQSVCGNMGYYADKSTGRGQLYLVTREEEPFCAHQYNVEIHNAFSDLPLRTQGKIEIVLEGEGRLNETFTITEKDDTEFFAGEKISRIIVPHPALGFPTSLTITYKSYNGWLSRGLSDWNVYKVSLTDSFGKSFSICKRLFRLKSGKPLYLSLLPGNCHIPEEESSIDNETEGYNHSTSSPILSDRYDGIPIDLTDDKATNGITIDFYNRNGTLIDKPVNILGWQPALEGNALDRDITETSRSLPDLNETVEIHEPILKEKRNGKSGKGRNLYNFGDDDETSEPTLKIANTTVTNKRNKTAALNDTDPDDAGTREEGGLLTVQLLPFRLGEIFERAERYARLTLLPLISEQAPRFFGFGLDEQNERSSKYIPHSKTDVMAGSKKTKRKIELNQFDATKATNMASAFTDDYSVENESDQMTAVSEMVIVPHSPPRQNIFEIIRYKSNAVDASGVAEPKVQAYYLNLRESLETGRQLIEADDMPMVRIELPTYRPPAIFPYEFDKNVESGGHTGSKP